MDKLYGLGILLLVLVTVTHCQDVHDHSGHDHGDHGHHGETTAAPPHGDHGEHGSHTEGGDPHSGHGSLGHSAFFYISPEAIILFEEWTTSTWQTMLGSCLAVGAVAALYEGFKVLREDLLSWSIRRREEEGKKIRGIALMCTGMHILQSLLHVIQVVISYLLMLVFMTFNLYLCIAVAAGAGIGYFLFAWRRRTVSDANEHCH